MFLSTQRLSPSHQDNQNNPKSQINLSELLTHLILTSASNPVILSSQKHDHHKEDLFTHIGIIKIIITKHQSPKSKIKT
jgi:hypothetical protein